MHDTVAHFVMSLIIIYVCRTLSFIIIAWSCYKNYGIICKIIHYVTCIMAMGWADGINLTNLEVWKQS